MTYTKLPALLNAWAKKIEIIIDKFLPVFSLTDNRVAFVDYHKRHP